MLSFLGISEIMESAPRSALSSLFCLVLVFFSLGWKVVLVDFSSWILSGSSIKQWLFLENSKAWASEFRNWSGTDLHQMYQLLQDPSNHQQALPCHSWERRGTRFPSSRCYSLSAGWGTRWTLPAWQTEMVFFWKLNFFSDKRIFLCQPQGLGGRGGSEDRKLGGVKGRYQF